MHLEVELSKYDEPRKGSVLKRREGVVREAKPVESCCITYGVLGENEQRTLREGVLHRVSDGVFSGISMVRMRQRIRQVEVVCGLSGGYFRLCGGNGNEELPRSGERGVEAEKQARATKEASWEAERLRGALGFVWLVLLTFVGVSCRAQPLLLYSLREKGSGSTWQNPG